MANRFIALEPETLAGTEHDSPEQGPVTEKPATAEEEKSGEAAEEEKGSEPILGRLTNKPMPAEEEPTRSKGPKKIRKRIPRRKVLVLNADEISQQDQQTGQEEQQSAHKGASASAEAVEGDIGSQEPLRASPEADSKTSAPLGEAQAGFLAMLAVRGNEQLIARYMQGKSLRRVLLATPVEGVASEGGGSSLKVEAGDVLHCEAADATGWWFGNVIAPERLCGQSGSFRCDGVRPVVAELQGTRDGDAFSFTLGSWAEAQKPQIATAQQRLRQKMMLTRLRNAQAAWKSKQAAR